MSADNAWLKDLIDLVAEAARSEVVELELTLGETRVYFRKEPKLGQQRSLTTSAAPPPPASNNSHVKICAPLSGIFYSAPSPGAPPYVKVGSRVEVGQVVALVEAMKVFNEVKAGHRGDVVSILVQDGQLVQKGQVLMELEER